MSRAFFYNDLKWVEEEEEGGQEGFTWRPYLAIHTNKECQMSVRQQPGGGQFRPLVALLWLCTRWEVGPAYARPTELMFKTGRHGEEGQGPHTSSKRCFQPVAPPPIKSPSNRT